MQPEDVTTPRRRSSRLSGPEGSQVDKPVAPLVPQRKTFGLKKMVPRKTQVAAHNKENDERLSNIPEKRPKLSTPATEKKTNVSTSLSEKRGKLSTTPSSEKQAKVSTPSSERRAKTPASLAPEKKSTPTSQKRTKLSSTPPSEMRPKIPSPVPEKESTPASQRKTKVSTSTSLCGTKPKASTPSSVKASKASTPAPSDIVPARRITRTRTPTVLSPIVAPQNQNQIQSPPTRNRLNRSDETWSQKVRRSYSRLSGGDSSFTSPLQQYPHDGSSSPLPSSRRETLFGFEKMPTPKVMRTTSINTSVMSVAHLVSSSTCGVPSALNLSGEADDNLNHSGEALSDPNIPGVAIHKKQAKKKKVQPITMSELDVLAAKMNSEFAEAEEFELVVE